MLCAVPADTGKWFADKGRRLVRFVSADHPYVYLSSCVLAALSVLVWLILLLLGTMVGMVVLRTIWSCLASVWNAVKVLIP